MNGDFKLNVTNDGADFYFQGKKLSLVNYTINFYTATDETPGVHNITCVGIDPTGRIYSVFYDFKTNKTTHQILNKNIRA